MTGAFMLLPLPMSPSHLHLCHDGQRAAGHRARSEAHSPTTWTETTRGQAAASEATCNNHNANPLPICPVFLPFLCNGSAHAGTGLQSAFANCAHEHYRSRRPAGSGPAGEGRAVGRDGNGICCLSQGLSGDQC